VSDPAARAVDRVRAHPLVRAVRPVLGEAPVCAVGGVVRDALLGVDPGNDLDLVVEGDAPALARAVGRALDVPVDVFGRFGTAALRLPGGLVDMVSARRETYPRPGALPEVTPGDLGDDLARRDFTVNAMAVGLSGPREGHLIDPHHGVADLGTHTLRTLRPGAFAEDPSRLVRGARYVARLGLGFDAATRAEARAAAAGLDLRSARVAEETGRLLAEACAGAALAVLGDLGVPWVVPTAAARVAAVERARLQPGAPPLPAWALRAGAGIAPDALAASALPGGGRALAARMADGPGLARRLAAAVTPSQIDRLLGAAPPAAAVAALAEGADAVARWWAGDRDRAVAVTGDDMLRAGIPPGPAVGRGLAAARAAMIDGRASTPADQLDAALAAAREEAT